jgi:predicted dehydrogenase
MLTAAIIGLGWWGKRHVEAAAGSALIRFVRGVTLEPDSVREFAAKHELTLHTSYEEILRDPAIEAVVIATPHTLHRAQVEAAAAAGKHVYCEKPFALSKADAEAALAACARAGVTLTVGHHFRRMPSVQALLRLLTAGTLGTVMHVEGNYSHDWLADQGADHWRTAREESRAGGMTGMGIHLIDSFGYLIGPMQRVAALSRRRALALPAGDTTAALIEFTCGATATLATTLKTPFTWRLAVYGSEARAESVSETRLIVHRAGQEPEEMDFPAYDHLREHVEAFAAAALGRSKPPIEPDEILHTVAVLDALFRSVDADGRWQTVA